MSCHTHQNQVYTIHSKVADGRTLIQAHLNCWWCRKDEPLTIRPDFPPSEVLRKFRQKGWETNDRDKRRCVCPTCIEVKKAEQKKGAKPVNHQSNVSKMAPAVIIPMPEPPVIRRILGIIEGHFDETKGCYLGDWNDKKVAAEIGIGFAVIAKVREEYGLKLKGDPELLALKAEVAAWIAMGDDLTARVAKLEAR